MPSSTFYSIESIVKILFKTKPKSVLDVGIGYGKYGLLVREYLEANYNNVFPEEWKIKLDGVEIFRSYVEKFVWLKNIYNNIYNESIVDFVKNNKDKYDLILSADVIEHLEKDKAIFVLNELVEKTNKVFILNIPIGKEWLNNKIVANNKYEKHLSSWNEKEILNIFNKNKKVEKCEIINIANVFRLLNNRKVYTFKIVIK